MAALCCGAHHVELGGGAELELADGEIDDGERALEALAVDLRGALGGEDGDDGARHAGEDGALLVLDGELVRGHPQPARVDAVPGARREDGLRDGDEAGRERVGGRRRARGRGDELPADGDGAGHRGERRRQRDARVALGPLDLLQRGREVGRARQDQVQRLLPVGEHLARLGHRGEHRIVELDGRGRRHGRDRRRRRGRRARLGRLRERARGQREDRGERGDREGGPTTQSSAGHAPLVGMVEARRQARSARAGTVCSDSRHASGRAVRNRDTRGPARRSRGSGLSRRCC